MRVTRFKDFEKEFGLCLLSPSLDSYRVGHKVEWNNLLKRRFEVEESYFINYFNVPSEVKNSLRTQLDQLNTMPRGNAQLPNIDLQTENELDASFNFPGSSKVSGHLNRSKVLQMKFENVKAVSLKNEVRDAILDKVLGIKADKKQFKAIDGIMFIEQLYYADRVVLTVEKSHAAELKGICPELKVDIDGTSTGTTHATIIFENVENCPFAAKFETVKDFAN